MNATKGVKTKISFMAIALAASLLLFVGHVQAAPATFTVTNTNDSGAGSLRQAIEDANNNGNPSDMDIIAFDIPGSEVHTINLLSDLPYVTEKATIDGYTQEGAQENTTVSPEPINSVIKVELAGGNGTITQGALALIADDSIVKGLSIYDFAEPNANFEKANLGLVGANTAVYGSYIGLRADGTTKGQDGRNSVGIGAAGNNVKVGGTNPSMRNVLSSKSTIGQSAAMAVAGSAAEIFGNYIGIAKDGVTDLTPEAADANGFNPPFSIGINLVASGGNIVGGPGAGEKNLITGNTVGVVVSTPNNVVQGNLVGTNYQGVVSESITNGIGMNAVAGTDSLIGGTNPGEGNTIAGVKGSGIEISDMNIAPLEFTVMPSKIAIIGNSISSISPFNLNGIGLSNLGIDISRFTDSDGNFVPETFESRGPNVNDASDADTGPNGLMNYPVLKTAQQLGNQLAVTYDVDAADSPSDTYRVDFYANSERSIFGYGPGETYLGAATPVSNGTDLTATITVDDDFVGKALSATVTPIDGTTSTGFGSTSEFSRNISIGSGTDFDADGIADAVEDGAPNNGDGNNDGTPDRLQPTISSYVAAEVRGVSTYATLMTEGCSENGTVSSLRADSLQKRDNGYEYPYGLTDFTLYCSRGDTVDVTMYIHADTDPQRYLPRKFNAAMNQFTDIPASVLTSEVVGNSTTLKLAYSVKDGGDLDDDGEENGVIVDPVGLATENNAVLANTGVITVMGTIIGILMLAGGLYTYIDYRKHKNPLKEADPYLASSYTYWHHLKVVSIPLASYRLRVTVEAKEQSPSTPPISGLQ